MTKRWESDAKVSGLNISRGTTYVFRYGLDGKWDRSIKIGNVDEVSLKKARIIATGYRLAVMQGEDPGAQKRERRADKTLRDLFPAYMEGWAIPRKSVKSAQNDEINFRLHIMRAPFANWRLRDIDQAALWEWHSSHPRPVTANRCLETLSKAFALAKRWGWADENPCHGIEHHPEKSRRRYASPDEVDRLLAELRAKKERGGIHFRFACLVQLLMLTGARRSEIMTARWSEVDLERGLITPAKHKTDKTEHREIVLGSDAMRVIRELQDHEPPSEWLIRGRGKNHMKQPQKPWTQLKEAAGIRNLWLHDLRHTFASYLLSSGQTLGVVGELLGHASVATTRRYAHLIDTERRRAVDQAGALLSETRRAQSSGRDTTSLFLDPAPLPHLSPSSAIGKQERSPCNVLQFPRGR
jgi:integrase